MDDSNDDEFFADFGDPGLTDRELDSVLRRARALDDREVRLLVKQYRTLRRATRWLLADLAGETTLDAVRHGEAARLARFVAGDERPS